MNSLISSLYFSLSTMVALTTTFSATKIGEPVRSARAMASEGRASISVFSGAPGISRKTPGEEGILVDVVHEHLDDLRAQGVDDIFQKIMGHVVPGDHLFLELDEDGRGFRHTDGNGQVAFSSSSVRMTMGIFNPGSTAMPRTFISIMVFSFQRCENPWGKDALEIS